jgi:very-short-patch-repair endonuclease
VAEFVRTHGGALPLPAISAAGFTARDVAEARRSGELIGVRRGWLAAPDAPADVVGAARVGGSLTAHSVARLHGLWLVEDPRLHVRVPSTASRLRSPTDAATPLDPVKHRVCVHYRRPPTASGGPDDEFGTDSPPAPADVGAPRRLPMRRGPDDLPARDGLPRALSELFRCGGVVPGMVALESALNLAELDAVGRATVRQLVPARARPLVDGARADAESGLETIASLLFRRRRIPYRTQTWFEGIGRVDLLVGDRLVIELDGERFHSGYDFEEDRRRDFELALRGYLVVRLSWRMTMHDWDRVERGVLELVERGAHRWGSVRLQEYPVRG